MRLTEYKTVQKNAKQFKHCLRNITLLPFESDYICIACG